MIFTKTSLLVSCQITKYSSSLIWSICPFFSLLLFLPSSFETSSKLFYLQTLLLDQMNMIFVHYSIKIIAPYYQTRSCSVFCSTEGREAVPSEWPCSGIFFGWSHKHIEKMKEKQKHKSSLKIQKKKKSLAGFPYKICIQLLWGELTASIENLHELNKLKQEQVK